jgi:hypothetical protein
MKELDKYRVRVIQDIMDGSPDESGDDAVFLVNYHRDFDVRRDKIVTEEQVRAYYLGEEHGIEGYYLFRLTMLSHSGVWLSLDTSFTCDPGGWDTSHVGLVFVSEKEAKDAVEALKYAKGLVSIWNTYLQGDVWGFVVEYRNECECCRHVEWEHVDSLWGIYGAEFVEENVPERFKALIPERDDWEYGG